MFRCASNFHEYSLKNTDFGLIDALKRPIGRPGRHPWWVTAKGALHPVASLGMPPMGPVLTQLEPARYSPTGTGEIGAKYRDCTAAARYFAAIIRVWAFNLH